MYKSMPFLFMENKITQPPPPIYTHTPHDKNLPLLFTDHRHQHCSKLIPSAVFQFNNGVRFCIKICTLQVAPQPKIKII